MGKLFIIDKTEIITESFVIAILGEGYDDEREIETPPIMPEPSAGEIQFKNFSDEWTFEYGERFMLSLPGEGERDKKNPIFEVVEGQKSIYDQEFKARRMFVRMR